MKAKIKISEAHSMADVYYRGRVTEINVDNYFYDLVLRYVKSIEFSNVYFSGCSKVKLEESRYSPDGVVPIGKQFPPNLQNEINNYWVCKVGLRRFGINWQEGIYIKIRR